MGSGALVYRQGILLFGLAALLCGCVSYRAAPVTPQQSLARLESGQLPARESWSRADLLAQAIASSPTLLAKAAAYRSAVAAAKAARVPLPAALQLTAEYSHQDNPRKPWLGSGVLDLPIALGGRRNARVREADLVVAQARLDYLDALWATRGAIDRAAISRTVLDRALPLAISARDLRRDRLERLQRRVQAGEDPQTVVLAARTELAAAERRLSTIQANRRNAVLALAAELGVSPQQAETIKLTTSEKTPIDARTLAGLRQEAALGRGDVLRAIADYDQAENALRLEVANQYPAIRIQPGYTYERGIVKLPFGVNLQLPPIDGNKAAIRAAEKRREEAAAKLEAAQAGVLAEVDRAQAALAAAADAEAAHEKQDVPAAHRLADAAAKSLAKGAADRIDEDAAAAAAVEADLDQIEASRTTALARSDLDSALRHTADADETSLFTQALSRLGDTK